MADDNKGDTPAQERKSADDAVRDAEAALQKARERLSDTQDRARAVKTKNMPMFVVEVLPNVHVQHEGKNYYGEEYGVRLDGKGNPHKERMLHGADDGTTLVLEGPTAMALVIDEKVQMIRSLKPGEKL